MGAALAALYARAKGGHPGASSGADADAGADTDADADADADERTPATKRARVAGDGDVSDPAAAASPAAADAPPIAPASTTPATSRRRREKRAAVTVVAEPAPGAVRTELLAQPPPPVTLADLGGLEGPVKALTEQVAFPLAHPEVYAWLGVDPPRGVLLHGPPGCGKTALAAALAHACGVPLVRASAPELVAGVSGESEANLRKLFDDARSAAPCVLFLDEVDAIAGRRDGAQRDMERRMVAQLLTLMDDVNREAAEARAALWEGGTTGDLGNRKGVALGVEPGAPDADACLAAQPNFKRHVVVLAATNRPDALDPALRRAGRFDREVAVGVPDAAGRRRILGALCRRLRLAVSDDNDDDARVATTCGLGPGADPPWLDTVARRTPGFVGADLVAVVREAAAQAVGRARASIAALATAAAAENVVVVDDADPTAANAGPRPAPATRPAPGVGRGIPSELALGRSLTPTELARCVLRPADFLAAVCRVQPSVRREGFSASPDASWADVGALGDIRRELRFAVTLPSRHPERFAAMGLRPAAGVLLFGPPGCGKTLVARAAAAESGANFVSVKGPELLSKWVGESERAVRTLFARARAAQPCVLFFDELDALAPRRSGNGGGGGGDGSGVAERLVNQLLAEMDGADARDGVFVVAATNRPDRIDPALMRPGRLDRLLYVPLPDGPGRAAVLRALTRKTPLGASLRGPDLRAGLGAVAAAAAEAAEADDAPAGDAGLAAIAADPRLEGFSGADLAALVREACVAALKEDLGEPDGPDPRDGCGADADAIVGEPDVDAAESAWGQGAGAPPPSAGGDGSAAAPPQETAPPRVERRHFHRAIARCSPSVAPRDRLRYDALALRLRSDAGSLIQRGTREGGGGGGGRGGVGGVGDPVCVEGDGGGGRPARNEEPLAV